MKKCEFLDLGEASANEEKKVDMALEKIEEHGLPAFVKEIPVSFRRKDDGENVTVDYKWESSGEGNIKIKKLVLRKGEALEGLYRINADREEQVFSLEYKNAVYVLRKTSEEVTEAIFKFCDGVKTGIENVVGYIKTVLGSFYLISRLPKNSWTFDAGIAGGELSLIDAGKLGEGEKRRLFDVIIEKVVELNHHGLILKDFTLNNVVLTNDSLVFTDMRNLRAAKKKTLLVEEFKKTVKYLINAGLGGKEHAYSACAYYCAAHTTTCEAWYSEKSGKDGDSYDIALYMEKDI
jgi:hypothetical protein